VKVKQMRQQYIYTEMVTRLVKGRQLTCMQTEGNTYFYLRTHTYYITQLTTSVTNTGYGDSTVKIENMCCPKLV
jgi:hypothetical protein